MPKIYVIGYYNHDNIGDEQYKLSFEYLFQSFSSKVVIDSVEFVDCDKIGNAAIDERDIILLGGGDILNNYFLDKINAFFSSKRNKILAVSVGLPYAGILINTQKLSIIDYLFIRTQQDKELISQYFLPERTFFFPDVSYFLVKRNVLREKTWERINGYPEYLNSKGILGNGDYSVHFAAIKDKIAGWYKTGKKIIVLSLNRHIYSPKYMEEYKKIVGKWGEFVAQLVKNDMVVVFLPFNTVDKIAKREDNMENDLLIHEDVLQDIATSGLLEPGLISERIITVATTLNVEDMLSLYDYFYMSIPMRFHACLFSTFKRVPMIPVFTTQKIYNLMLDLSWDYFYEMDKNNIDIPLDLDVSRLWLFLQKWLNPGFYLQGKKKLEILCTDFFEKGHQDGLVFLEEKIGEEYARIKTTGFRNQNDVLIEEIFTKVSRYAETGGGVSDFRLLKATNMRWNVVHMVSYYLTKNVDSIYIHGLMEKMFQTVVIEKEGAMEERGTFKYKDEWLWIIKDRQLAQYNQRKRWVENGGGNAGNIKKGYFCLNYLEQEDYSNVHRSGWQYVFENIQHLESSQSPLLLDLYLDKTFHWKKEIYNLLGVIPYKQSWVGFIHHTMDTSFSHYNIPNMVKNPDFIASLAYCKGLFVLSKLLKAQLEQYLRKMAIGNIPRVYAFIHPTEIKNIPTFNMRSFLANTDKKLVHVGGWLRNIFSFYFLKLPETSQYKMEILNCGGLWRLFNKSTSSVFKNQPHSLRKAIIKGNHMNNYFPEDSFLEKIQSAFSVVAPAASNGAQTSSDEVALSQSGAIDDLEVRQPQQNAGLILNASQNVSQNATEITNNWNKHFYDFLASLDEKMEIIEHLDNDKYDELLSENIVCIHLVDASAVNTLIECIVRNTPIIVNRHPAVVELLGPWYPLYYGDSRGGVGHLITMNSQVEYLLKDLKNIELAHEYLKKINKTPFKIETFIQQLIQVINSL